VPIRADPPCGENPSLWVKRFLPLIPKLGPVLDLAAGSGRHTALLVERGYRVLAIDREVNELRERFADIAAVEIRAIDLEDGGPWRLGSGYSGVVVTNYLHRPLLPALAKALAQSGVLIYETFMAGNERFGRPSNPEFLLRPGELLRAFSTLTPIAFEQGQVEDPRPAMVQRLAAINGAVPAAGAGLE
jgi:SAM-dependent methyltransferase